MALGGVHPRGFQLDPTEGSGGQSRPKGEAEARLPDPPRIRGPAGGPGLDPPARRGLPGGLRFLACQMQAGPPDSRMTYWTVRQTLPGKL